MRNALRTVLWLLLWLPLVAFTQGLVTSTRSSSIGVGATNAIFGWTASYVGPQTIQIGDQGICTISPPPYPN
jgi:hypothetical protein